MKVCIAEKPSVAREIALILSADTKKDGYYEGNGYQVTWTFGHFCSLYNPDDYRSDWRYWEIQNLPMLPEKFKVKLIDNDGVKKQFAIIKSLFQNAEEVINCGDAGQEGELIQRWVIQEAGYKGKVRRLWISSLTSEAIKEGFQKLQDSSKYDNLYYAGSSRAIGDWLLGMNATRLFTLKYAGPKQVLSIGRVQTPTLAMLVDRYHEIANFKSEAYWELQTNYRDVVFNYEEGKFNKIEEGKSLLNKIEGKEFSISDTSRKKGKEYAPSLFDLTGLQVYCNTKFGFTADQTLKIVQRLYEQKLVSYPRVDTNYLPEDLYPQVPKILAKLKRYSPLVSDLLKEPIRKSKKVFNDKKVTDHHAIIPTGEEGQLSLDDEKVYDAISRHFIAAFYPDCIVANSQILGRVEDVVFKSTGKEILEDGWRLVLGKSSSKDEDKVLPSFTKGEKGPHSPSLNEKQTKAPRNYTEASLLRAMETAGKTVEDEELRDLLKANGIGRPSTRANIIETLFKRNYIYRNKKQVLPTQMGIQLIDTIENDLLKSAELTGQWEKQLKEIEEGEYKAVPFINNMKRMVYDLVKEVKSAKDKPRIAQESVDKAKKESSKAKKDKNDGLQSRECPKCKKGSLLEGKTGFGCSRWKEACDFLLPKKYLEKKISEKQWIRLLEKGETVQLKGFKKEGQSYTGKITLNEHAEISFEAQENSKDNEKKDLSCPKCKKGIVIKGKSAYGCSEWRNGCDFKVDFNLVKTELEGKLKSKSAVWEILKSKA
tara:strand:- start:71857 stop:74151 length:2295 start_codon:yes stop_codon:yes gene_type:complete